MVNLSKTPGNNFDKMQSLLTSGNPACYGLHMHLTNTEPEGDLLHSQHVQCLLANTINSQKFSNQEA